MMEWLNLISFKLLFHIGLVNVINHLKLSAKMFKKIQMNITFVNATKLKTHLLSRS